MAQRRDGNTPCEHCGHPEAVHGGFARPGSRCAYRGCDCQGYDPEQDESGYVAREDGEL